MIITAILQQLNHKQLTVVRMGSTICLCLHSENTDSSLQNGRTNILIRLFNVLLDLKFKALNTASINSLR